MPDAYFIGDVEVKWLKDGRKMKLLSDFGFIDHTGKQWLAPADRTVDGASIPRFFWSVIGSPFIGKFRRASVLHDVACVDRTEPYEDVHRMFYEAMLADNTPALKARKMYAAVRNFGPRWDEDGNDLATEDDDLWDDEF